MLLFGVLIEADISVARTGWRRRRVALSFFFSTEYGLFVLKVPALLVPLYCLGLVYLCWRLVFFLVPPLSTPRLSCRVSTRFILLALAWDLIDWNGKGSNIAIDFDHG